MRAAKRAGRPPYCVVHNPRAGSAERLEALLAVIGEDGRFDVCPTAARGDSARIAAEAAARGAELVVAAGGDGTVSEVVSGLMQARKSRRRRLPDLLVVPMGTGNDLARTLQLPDTPAEAVALLQGGRRRALDVLDWRLRPPGGAEKRGWSVNVIAGGFSAKLKEALTPDVKKFWGPLAYARAALGSIDELEHPHDLRFSADGGRMRRAQAINVIVANARYAGGGMEVAPHADPSDGRLELVVITPGGLLDLAEVTAKLLVGEVDESEHTFHISAARVRLSAKPAMPFNIDGEPVGEGNLSIRVIPGAIQVLVPPAEE